MKQIPLRTSLIFVTLVLLPSQAFAYLDPGTGSMILQGIIAAIAIAGFTIKSYWYKILGFFGKKAPTSLLEDEQDQEEKN